MAGLYQKNPGPSWDPVEEEDSNENSLFFGFSDFANHLVRGAGLVHAERLFRQEVASGGVGAGAASHANMAKLAATALPFQIVVVAQLVEDDGICPDVGEALLTEVAGDRGQVSAREDFALMRDEAHARSGEAALSHRVHVAGVAARMSCVSHGRTAAWLQRNSCRSRHRHFCSADVSRRRRMMRDGRGRYRFARATVGSAALARNAEIMRRAG